MVNCNTTTHNTIQRATDNRAYNSSSLAGAFKTFEFVVLGDNARYKIHIDAMNRNAASQCLDDVIRYGASTAPYNAVLAYVQEV